MLGLRYYLGEKEDNSSMTGNNSLRLFIDSADIKEWQNYLGSGLFYGVTTNPKLLAKTGREFSVDQLAFLAGNAFELGAQEIHLQVWGRAAGKMLETGRQLSSIDPRVLVKVPATPAGISCASALIKEGSRVTLTALHSASQVLIAHALGACYAAPYLGRMTDSGLDGLEEVITMERILSRLESPVRLLVASIREVGDLAALAAEGLNTFTLLPSLIEQLLSNKLTELAAASFEQAAGLPPGS
jgi:transaldolase